jgi:hypothetical protein
MPKSLPKKCVRVTLHPVVLLPRVLPTEPQALPLLSPTPTSGPTGSLKLLHSPLHRPLRSRSLPQLRTSAFPSPFRLPRTLDSLRVSLAPVSDRDSRGPKAGGSPLTATPTGLHGGAARWRRCGGAEEGVAAAGTVAGVVDEDFSSASTLELFGLDFRSDAADLPLLVSAPAPDRFHRLRWSTPPSSATGLPCAAVGRCPQGLRRGAGLISSDGDRRGQAPRRRRRWRRKGRGPAGQRRRRWRRKRRGGGGAGGSKKEGIFCLRCLHLGLLEMGIFASSVRESNAGMHLPFCIVLLDSPAYSRAHFLLFLSFLRSALRSAGIHFSCERRSCVCPCLPLMA